MDADALDLFLRQLGGGLGLIGQMARSRLGLTGRLAGRGLGLLAATRSAVAWACFTAPFGVDSLALLHGDLALGDQLHQLLGFLRAKPGVVGT